MGNLVGSFQQFGVRPLVRLREDAASGPVAGLDVAVEELGSTVQGGWIVELREGEQELRPLVTRREVVPREGVDMRRACGLRQLSSRHTTFMQRGDRTRNVNPPELAPARGFSHATVAGDTVWIGGQIGSDPTGKVVEKGDVVAQFARAMRDLTREVKTREEEIRGLVIRGQGRGFCSGGDVDESVGELLKRGTRDVYEFARMTGECVRNLREMPQPVVAAVNGVAAGAGAVLAAAADIRILAESASFRFLFTSVGLSGGDMGICWLLPRIVGLGRATEALLLGGKIGSHQAEAWGLASRVVADDQLDVAVSDYVTRLKELAPWGLAMTKEMVNRGASTDYSTAVEMEAFTQTLLMTAEDFREFHAGFTGKRKPAYRGR